MENLATLAKRISSLVSRTKELKIELEKSKADYTKLAQKNEQLTQKLDSMKTAAQSSAKSYDEERGKAQELVDELIRNIDTLISEQQP